MGDQKSNFKFGDQRNGFNFLLKYAGIVEISVTFAQQLTDFVPISDTGANVPQGA